MKTTTSNTLPVGLATVERLLHGVDVAIWACAAYGWSPASRKALHGELLMLATNLGQYLAAARNDARRSDPQATSDGHPEGAAHWETERIVEVPNQMAARLAAYGEDREAMYRIRDEFELFERELRDYDAFREEGNASEEDDQPAPEADRVLFLRRWHRLRFR